MNTSCSPTSTGTRVLLPAVRRPPPHKCRRAPSPVRQVPAGRRCPREHEPGQQSMDHTPRIQENFQTRHPAPRTGERPAGAPSPTGHGHRPQVWPTVRRAGVLPPLRPNGAREHEDEHQTDGRHALDHEHGREHEPRTAGTQSTSHGDDDEQEHEHQPGHRCSL